MPALPDSVLELNERALIEDVLLALFADKMPDVNCGTKISKGQTFPYVLVRRSTLFGDDTGDPRFIDRAPVIIQCYVEDSDESDGDVDAGRLAEAVRVVLRDAAIERKVYSGLGYILKVEMPSAPRRVSDWATSSGPVQYADLPTGVWRYETQYTVAVRIPTSTP